MVLHSKLNQGINEKIDVLKKGLSNLGHRSLLEIPEYRIYAKHRRYAKKIFECNYCNKKFVLFKSPSSIYQVKEVENDLTWFVFEPYEDLIYGIDFINGRANQFLCEKIKSFL